MKIGDEYGMGGIIYREDEDYFYENCKNFVENYYNNGKKWNEGTECDGCVRWKEKYKESLKGKEITAVSIQLLIHTHLDYRIPKKI